MPGQERIERMLREVWQRCRVRFEQALRPFEIALGECLNELFRDSTDWPARWAAFVAEWHARGVLISEPSQSAVEQLLDLVARKQPIPRDPSGRYFMPTAAAATTPPPSNATSPNWPALTEPQREQIRNEVGLSWWYPVPAKAPGDSAWEKILEVKGRQARDKLLAFFQSLEALGAQADHDQGDSDDGLDALANHVGRVREAYDAYIASYISLLQYSLHYMETQLFLGIFVAGLMQKLDLALPSSLFGMHSRYERELMEVQAALSKASSSLQGRVDVTYTAAVWTDRVITLVAVVAFVGAATAVAKTAAAKAVAQGATRSAAANLAIKAGIKQAAKQAVLQLAIGTVLPNVLTAAGLDEQQVRKGLLLLDAVAMLMNLRTLRSSTDGALASRLNRAVSVSAGRQSANGVTWRNGWRTADGRFASPLSPSRPGKAVEEDVWDAIEAKPGWQIIRGEVSVRDANGKLRKYDGMAISPKKRTIGLEIKSGTGRRRASQREFDEALNRSGSQSLPTVGAHQGRQIRRAKEIRRP